MITIIINERVLHFIFKNTKEMSGIKVLVLNIFVFICLSQKIQLFCDIQKWDILYGYVDICPPYYPCCFHFRGNASIQENINDVYSFKSIGNSWDILYFNTEYIPINDDRNNLIYSDSYNCSGQSGMRKYVYKISDESITVTNPDIGIYYKNAYYCNGSCSDPTSSPTVKPKTYDNTDNIYESMCNNITRDPDWMNSGNPNAISQLNSIICPSITNKQCCTSLQSQSIWIVKSYNLTLFTNIYLHFSMKNQNFEQNDRTQIFYNCGFGDWIELYITTSDNTVVTEQRLISECNNSPNVSIAFWVHYTKSDILDKYVRIGDYEICNGRCVVPTYSPSQLPSLSPSISPTMPPTGVPSNEPTMEPTIKQTTKPAKKNNHNAIRVILSMYQMYMYT